MIYINHVYNKEYIHRFFFNYLLQFCRQGLLFITFYDLILYIHNLTYNNIIVIIILRDQVYHNFIYIKIR